MFLTNSNTIISIFIIKVNLQFLGELNNSFKVKLIDDIEIIIINHLDWHEKFNF